MSTSTKKPSTNTIRFQDPPPSPSSSPQSNTTNSPVKGTDTIEDDSTLLSGLITQFNQSLNQYKWLYPAIVLSPIIIVNILLFLSWCGPDEWREGLNVLVIKNGEAELSLTALGWCLKESSTAKLSCSKSTFWYDLEDMPRDDIKQDISSWMTHAFILNPTISFLAMTSLLTILLHIWQRRCDTSLRPGMIQFGPQGGFTFLTILTWIIESVIVNTLKYKIGSNDVEAGMAFNFIIISSVILILHCSFWTGPAMITYLKLYFKEQRAYLASWRNGDWRDMEQGLKSAGLQEKDDKQEERGTKKKGEVRRGWSFRHERDRRHKYRERDRDRDEHRRHDRYKRNRYGRRDRRRDRRQY